MKQSKVSCGDFVITNGEIESIVKGAIGLVKNIMSSDELNVYFVGSDAVLAVKASDIALIDIEKTGKGFGFKVCNVCHILKAAGFFNKN